MEKLKANLDLYGILLKLRECEVIFFDQIEKIRPSSPDLTEQIEDEFSEGLYHCMNSIKDLIGESAMCGVYDIIPIREYKQGQKYLSDTE